MERVDHAVTDEFADEERIVLVVRWGKAGDYGVGRIGGVTSLRWRWVAARVNRLPVLRHVIYGSSYIEVCKAAAGCQVHLDMAAHGVQSGRKTIAKVFEPVHRECCILRASHERRGTRSVVGD